MGKVHFWLHNIGTIMVLTGMYFFTIGEEGFAFPFALTGALIVLGATVVFVVNMFMNINYAETFERNK
ncbi:hypothetical protein [Planococcus sp. 4-30]|uniref:hypothetical protein n=1 Tax=Planococcus sp. 4-30 TaxID=2874583 RepID=UPI001CBB64AC|nr:hypothetical protein [Planococcus sp. 4-30]